MEKVKAKREKLPIKTYGVGAPEKNPMFFEKRVYQGSCGRRGLFRRGELP